MPRRADTADYRCCACAHRWRGAPGPVTCPRCGELYVYWLNYAELFEPGRDAQPSGNQ
ncbi:hypothetical protein [Rhodovibrio sodomensis]|uniref:hypothetical protein n=1 Tax=Rhodovibrio sodomensis TaxID=1088 RepID=UPI001904F2B0|nr:hypothetical protein [Rhodovibrio sodomensis]